MGKTAIFIHAELSFWIDVAVKLRDNYDWEICYLVGQGKHKEKALKLFPHAVYQTTAEAKKAQRPEGCETFLHSPLDSRLLSALACHESIFMKMLDRYNFNGSFTYHERLFTYHSHIMYWKGVLDNFRPELVVFRIEPHMGYDYALYSLCKVMDIPTVMFERTCLPGYAYPVRAFEVGSVIIQNAYYNALKTLEKRSITLTPQTESHFENLTKSYADAMPFHEKFKSKHYKKQGDVGGLISIIFLIAKGLVKGLLKKKTLNHVRKRFHKNTGLLKRRKLMVHYHRLAKAIDMTKPYMFVALQCEPERQTCPVGGMHGHQYIMIDLLSKIVPDDWKVYVKEHRSQFKTYQAVERAKTTKYYNHIASMPNVELVPLSYNSFELIDCAKATVTVSGTVGWESVVRGRPTLLFGNSWYRDCKGVFTIRSVEDCEKAIQKIQNGYAVKADEVKCFAQVVESYSAKCYIDPVYEKMNIVPLKANVANLATAIHEFIASSTRSTSEIGNHPDKLRLAHQGRQVSSNPKSLPNKRNSFAKTKIPVK